MANNIFGFGLNDTSNIIIPDPFIINDIEINNSITFYNRNNNHLSLREVAKGWLINVSNPGSGFTIVDGGLSGYDTTSGIFTAPKTATYHVIFNTYDLGYSINASEGILSIYFSNNVTNELYSSSSQILQPNTSVPTTNGTSMSCSWMGILNAGDTIRFEYYFATLLPTVAACVSSFKAYINAIY